MAASEAPAFANEFMKYIDVTPTPFHLCHETAARLTAAGFSECDPIPPRRLPPPPASGRRGRTEAPKQLSAALGTISFVACRFY